MLTPLAAMIRKDLQLFFSDRRAVIMAFAVPIAIASFFGSIFSGDDSNGRQPVRIAVAIVDQDGSSISRSVVSGAGEDRNLRIITPSEEEARAQVRSGRTSVAVIIPKGFGPAASRALLSGVDRPELTVLFDPSKAIEVGLVRGILIERTMQSVTREVFRGGPAISMPYTVHQEALTSGNNVAYNGYAHSFAGMGIQFLLFSMINLAIEILLERQRGLWKRLRSAPVSKALLLGGKVVSMSIVALMTLFVSFGFAMVVFKVRIQGSVPGFLLVSVATALMAATFGLLIAAVGKTPASARGVSVFAVLIMVMLGGAWVPTFIFPRWLQQLTVIVPARWAVDGLDAMTWRGLGLSGAVTPALVLLGFAVLFGSVAFGRFRWEEA